MKFEDLNAGLIQKAVDIYCQAAYPNSQPKIDVSGLLKAETCEECLQRFQDESGRDVEKKLHRYSLRLGNQRYPFMKLVVQEVLLEGQYFFTVDTHDHMEVKPSYPDYTAWKELKGYNAHLKLEIERKWYKAGLPTYASLPELADQLIPEHMSRPSRKKILVVDDEPAIRDTIAAMLVGRGYLVDVANDGSEVLERAKTSKPDLVILDYEMEVMDGLTTLEKLRADKETQDIRVLLATAGQIDLQRTRMANGFLVKPFQCDVLFTFVEHLLK